MSIAGRMWTVGTMATAAGVAHHVVEHHLASRKIKHEAMAGNSRVFSSSVAEQVVADLKRIAETRAASRRSAAV